MKYQRGVSLNALMIGGAVVAVLSLGLMKVLPDWMEYGRLKKVIATVAADSSLKDSSMSQVRGAYQKRAEIDDAPAAAPPSDEAGGRRSPIPPTVGPLPQPGA